MKQYNDKIVNEAKSTTNNKQTWNTGKVNGRKMCMRKWTKTKGERGEKKGRKKGGG